MPLLNIPHTPILKLTASSDRKKDRVLKIRSTFEVDEFARKNRNLTRIQTKIVISGGTGY